MPLKFIVEDVNEVDESLRGEYAKGEDGKYYLKIEGTIPELEESKAKVAEFRDNNIELLKERDGLSTKLKGFEGIDPTKYKELMQQVEQFKSSGITSPPDMEMKIQQAVAAAVTPLQEQLTAMQKEKEEATEKLKRREVEGNLTKVGIDAGVEDKAIPDFLSRGLKIFNLEGVAMNGDKPIFSKKKPDQKMSMEEWAAELLQEAPHLFRISKGGGAGGLKDRSRDGKTIITGTDPLEFGKHLEGIEKGDVVVTGNQ
jgi:hypothetical protein